MTVNTVAPPATDLLTGQPIPLRRQVSLHVCYQPGADPPIVFLHGGLGNRFNWRNQIEFAHQQGWRILAYDLAGHGDSTPYDRYSLGRHCRDLKRLLQRFEIENPILCCHSYGVPLGLEWAKSHRIRGLIAISGGTHNLTPWWEIPLIKALAWGGRHLSQLPGSQTILKWVAGSAQSDTLERFYAECPLPRSHHAYRALEIFWGYNFFRSSRKSWDPAVPVLVISGGQDPAFTQPMGDEFASRFPLGEHLHLPQSTHPVMADLPEQVNQAIKEWIQFRIST